MELIKNTSKRRQQAVRRIARNFGIYFAVCAYLTFINWYTSPGHWWVVWVIMGWGFGLLLPLITHLTKDYDEEDDK